MAEEPGSPTGGAILNADGVYLATYSALLLNLKLLRNGYYLSEEKSLCMAEVSIQRMPAVICEYEQWMHFDIDLLNGTRSFEILLTTDIILVFGTFIWQE